MMETIISLLVAAVLSLLVAAVADGLGRTCYVLVTYVLITFACSNNYNVIKRQLVYARQLTLHKCRNFETSTIDNRRVKL